MKLKIGVLTNYDYSDEERRMRSQDEDCKFIFLKNNLSAAISIGIYMQNELHVHAILTTSHTCRYIKNVLDIPVLPLFLKNYDIIRALLKARTLGHSPAFVAVDTVDERYNFQEICQLLSDDFEQIRYYPFNGLEYVDKILDQVEADGCDTVISMGNITIPHARERGLKTVFMTPDISTFWEAVEQVKNIYAEVEKSNRKSKWVNAVVSETGDGILGWEANGKITIFNNSAQTALQLEAKELLGTSVCELPKMVPEFSKILNTEEEYSVAVLNGQEYMLRHYTVCDPDDNNLSLGEYLRIFELKKIQNMELYARRELSKTGFVAETHFPDIKGSSTSILEAKDIAQQYARADSNILICGESGCGKEVFAQSIHNFSKYKNGPFVAVNCTALTDTLLESELFGYEEGAFTGAKKGGKPGLFELSNGGTLFLDEIGDMPLHLQAKLLRVLQERVVRRVGGNKSIPVNVRFICATNRDLREEVRNSRFREDLYFRINVLSLTLPPLRERREDIPILARDLAAKICKRMGRSFFFPENCDNLLQQYDWPGNVRELSNFMERAIVLNMHDRKMVEDAIHILTTSKERGTHSLTQPETPSSAEQAPSIDSNMLHIHISPLREMENEIILMLYEKYGRNKKRLERVLDVSTTTLWRRLKALSADGAPPSPPDLP